LAVIGAVGGVPGLVAALVGGGYVVLVVSAVIVRRAGRRALEIDYANKQVRRELARHDQ